MGVKWDAIRMKNSCITIALLGLLGGCTAPRVDRQKITELLIDVRSEIVVIDPVSHDFLDWSDVMLHIKKADVVLLGELHDHVIGHAVQLAIVEDVMDRYPGSVLALEMLERDEQVLVDDFMEGIVTARSLENLTHSTDWGASGGWGAWYQPILEATKERGGKVVAANAPRRYVRLARTDGYERIDALPQNRRSLIDYPEELSGGRYRERFWEFAMHDGDAEIVRVDVSSIAPDDPVLPVFRSQQVWDATMAQSVVNADPTLSKKVVLLVGQFHVEYNGGLVQEIKKRNPDLSIVVVSIQREIPEEDWRGTKTSPPIADLMIVETINE